MRPWVWFSLCIMTLNLTGCYVYDQPDERQAITAKTTSGTSLEQRRSCRFTGKSGCLTGQIVVAPNIFVNGKQLFDIDTLGQHLGEFLNVKDANGEMADLSKYRVEVTPAINNELFTQNFQIYLKGDRVIGARSGDSGLFKVNYLAEGVYDFRVQKNHHLKVVPIDPSASTPTLDLCLVIYGGEAGMEVFAGEETYRPIDRFTLRVDEGAQCQ